MCPVLLDHYIWQWLGVKQVAIKVIGKKMPEYYRVRKEGIKKYIRFPHHTCLIFFFWLHPVMTMDTLFLAVSATIYLYIGTYHQDMRGLRLIGEDWRVYRTNTNLLLPSLRTITRMISDFKNRT
jgi:methanethiol S-methyltransferase